MQDSNWEPSSYDYDRVSEESSKNQRMYNILDKVAEKLCKRICKEKGNENEWYHLYREMVNESASELGYE